MQIVTYSGAEIIKLTLECKPIKKTNSSSVFFHPDGYYIKLYNQHETNRNRIIAKHLSDSINQKIKIDPRVKTPSEIIYQSESGQLALCKIPPARGISLKNFLKQISYTQKLDLTFFAKIYMQIEDIMKNSPKLVFTDLLNTENIFIEIVDGEPIINIIDYDEIQLVGNSVVGITKVLLNEQTKFGCPLSWKKYSTPCYNQDFKTSFGSITTELNIKNLIYLYFNSVFRINLAFVGKEEKGTMVTLDDIFNIINFTDEEPLLCDLMQKVWLLNQPNRENQSIQEEIYELARYFQVVNIAEISNSKNYIRCLTKKEY